MTKRRDCLTASLYIQPKRIFCPEEKTRPGKLSYDFCIWIQTNPTGLTQESQISDILCRIRHRLHRIYICFCGAIGNHPETRVNISALYRPVFFHPVKSVHNAKIRLNRNDKIVNHFGKIRMMYRLVKIRQTAKQVLARACKACNIMCFQITQGNTKICVH